MTGNWPTDAPTPADMFPGGRGTGAGVTTHDLWCAIQQGYACNCGGTERRAADDARANLTPEQRKQAEREAEQTLEQRTKAALDAQADMIAEDGANIIKQQNASDALSKWVQECSDGISNLGRRVAQLEDWKARAIKAVPQLGKQAEEDNRE